MGISSLRPFLQSLCCNSPWSYAVFWKLKHQHEMILLWEDGFCDILKPKNSNMGSPGDSYLGNSNKILSSTLSSSVLDGTIGEYSVGLAVTEMSSASHVVGKGVVGEASYTGNARWIYSDNIATDLLDPVLISEYPDEWLLQFAAGVKTILLVPTLSQGVLQLGSTEMVTEDPSFVAHVRDKFEAHMKSDGNESRHSSPQFSLLSTFMETFDEPSSITTEKVNEDHNINHAVGTKDCNLFANQIIPGFTDLCDASVTRPPNTLENEIDNISQQPLSIIHEAEPSCGDNASVITGNNILKSDHPDEKVRAFPYCDNFQPRMYGDFMNEVMNIHFEEGATGPTFIENHFDDTSCRPGNNLFSFPWDCELHNALGTAVLDNTYQYTYDSSIFVQDMDNSLIHNMPAVEHSGFPMKEVNVEHLLESILANPPCRFDDNSSNKSDITSCNMASGKVLAPSKRASQPKRRAPEEGTSPWSFLTSSFIAQERTASSVESEMSVHDYKPQRKKEYDSLSPGKLSRLSTTNKRRVRGEDNQKPRPRDRQLIQDRIKELRELVPNSEKCSIDGLLDKTIKHMLFLASVTNQADKLRRQILKEKAGEKVMKTAEVNQGRQNGTSWAVEIGSEQEICPIVVKDLDHPGHMLIEMLCIDHGRFLEIADVIHKLHLTIIKGAMEKCSDNTWARFIVETSGNFHRLDIFWPLMQLLQQNRSPLSSKI